MQLYRERVAGLDVHKKVIVACARVVLAGELFVASARFKATPAGLRALAEWLHENQVTSVLMESTGVYWRPVFYALEDDFDQVEVANAHHVKNVPGRKRDSTDAQWLAEVAAHGMVRPSFVPPPRIRELRELTRYRKNQIEERTREKLRFERLLQDAGVKLTSVGTKTFSKTNQAIVRAMVNGERDPDTLAGLACGTLRNKIPELREVLPARFGDTHAVIFREILHHIDQLDRSIGHLDEIIAIRMAGFGEDIELLCTIPGVALRTAQVFIAETGGDMSVFPTAGHLAAWAGVAPASHESAGRSRPAGSRHGNQQLKTTMMEAAQSAARTKTYFGAKFHAVNKRRGAKRAVGAVANKLVVTMWHVLTDRHEFIDLGADWFKRQRDPEADKARLVAQLERAGYKVTLEPAA